MISFWSSVGYVGLVSELSRDTPIVCTYSAPVSPTPWTYVPWGETVPVNLLLRSIPYGLGYKTLTAQLECGGDSSFVEPWPWMVTFF